MSTKSRLESLVKNIYSLDRAQIERALNSIISDMGAKEKTLFTLKEIEALDGE